MAQWAISPVVGGTGPDDPYRPKAADYATDWGAVIVDGMNWCIVRATAGDLAAADADPDIILFPDLTMGTVLTLAQRNWLITRLNARGLPSGWVTAGITFGQALRTMGRWLDDRFEVTWIQ